MAKAKGSEPVADDAVSDGTKDYLEGLNKGYLGENPVAEVIPNSAYALTSGPDGVPLHHEVALAHDALTTRSDVLSEAKAANYGGVQSDSDETPLDDGEAA